MEKDPFTQLRFRFRDRCIGDLAVLRSFRDGLDRAPEDRIALVRTSHSLAGGGGTFGFAEVSDRASALESLLIDEGANDREIEVALNRLIVVIEDMTGVGE